MIRILLYFMGCGLWYGTMFGLITGIGFYPVWVSWSSVGGSFGLLCGFLCGLFMIVYHRLFFHSDIDIALYRRRVALCAGLGTGFCVLMYLLFDRVEKHLPNWPYEFIRFMLVFSPFIILGGFAMAYTAHQYPVWIVRQITMEGDLPRQGPRISTERNRLLRHIHRRWVMVLIGLPAACVHIYSFNRYMFLFPCPETTYLMYFLFILIALLFSAYCAQGNALLITFVKVLILEDYFPHISAHWHRVILTLLSFVYTLVTTWWTLLLAPLYALFIAYHVYHTLALRDEGSEKAKRKEKIA